MSKIVAGKEINEHVEKMKEHEKNQRKVKKVRKAAM